MSNYMRIMIYLRKKEDTNQTIGYLRLERKGGYLFFSLVLTGADMPANCPIYVVYDREERQQHYCLGNTSGGDSSEGRILLSQLPQRECENAIYGALVGTRENYLTGVINSHFELPVWQQEAEQREEEEAPVQEEAAAQEEITVQEEAIQEEKFFEDDELVWCRRLHPAEISGMHMEEWYLAANSFLLQGYYNYHHLIYASDGEKVYVGVPGQYHRRELYMAKRFGFPIFKSRRNKSLRIGDFGYWLREVKKDV